MAIFDPTELNLNQLDAYNWNDGPLIVLAGRGAGKTTTLSCRINRFIEESPGSYWRILALSPTSLTVSEIRSGVKDKTLEYGNRVKILTFHSFSENLLSLHGSHIGLKPDFTTISDKSSRVSILNDVIKKAQGGFSDLTGETLLPAIDRYIESVRDSNICGTMADTLGIESRDLEFIFKKYRNEMIERNMLDVPTLIIEALGLIRGVAGIRKQMYRAYRYICVDELQHTNFPQFQLLCELVNRETNNLFVVADDDQNTDQWNGENPNRIVELRNKLDMKVVNLPENYRCPPNVVKIANRLIRENSKRFKIKKDIEPHRKVLNVLRFSHFGEESSWVARSIANRPIDERSKCVVLARTKKLLDEVIEQLKSYSLVGFSGLRKNEFLSFQLDWLHSILRLANARSSSVYLYKVCKSFSKLAGIDTNPSDIILNANSRDGDFLREWANSVLKLEPSSIQKELIENAVLTLLADRLNHEEFLTEAFRWLDTTSEKIGEGNRYQEYYQEKEAWNALIRDIYNHLGVPKISLNQLLQKLDLRSKTPKPPKGAIPCVTIHAAKGMEFDHVYLIGMVEDQLPSWMAIKKGDDSIEMEEERRGCFVAITRTQESLHLTYSDMVNNWRKEPSRFLSEMGVLNQAVRPKDSDVKPPNSIEFTDIESDRYRSAS